MIPNSILLACCSLFANKQKKVLLYSCYYETCIRYWHSRNVLINQKTPDNHRLINRNGYALTATDSKM